MNENVKKFMELISAEGQESVERMNKADRDELIAMAAERGITLTEEDFKPMSGELSDDEMEAVAGGFECACPFGKMGNDSCYCLTCGMGSDDGGSQGRCECVIFGFAGDTK